MEIKFVLDFDGVLFNSAFEAFTVANRATAGRAGYRQDVAYAEFLEFRGRVTDAWQYHRLYSETHGAPASALKEIEPEDEDWRFARDFFDARREGMVDADWPKAMPPYDFFLLLKPLLLAAPERFAILSTRNVESIRETLAFHGADVVEVFGQEDIRRLGGKLAVARAQQWLHPGKWLVVYVDDMNSHIEPFQGQIHLPLQANWGYDVGAPGSLSANQIHSIIVSLLAIAGESRA
jgi:phosphoglycolate phosphatase-like HAD superfamily hydrolase